jgi:hypothetical protein
MHAGTRRLVEMIGELDSPGAWRLGKGPPHLLIRKVGGSHDSFWTLWRSEKSAPTAGNPPPKYLVGQAIVQSVLKAVTVHAVPPDRQAAATCKSKRYNRC